MVATATDPAVAGVDSSRMTIYQSRWSAKRLRDIANAIQGKKRDVISKSSFGDLLYISPFLPPPEELLDFLVMRIDTNKRLLKINENKKIHLTRDMVKKIFNVPSGCRPLEFGKRGKADFREVYLDGERAPIPSTIVVLSKADDNDEETIERSWALLCLALVLTPGTGNMVPLEYLYTFRDMSVVHEFAFDEHILSDVMKEVKKYQERRNDGKAKFLIRGCLPMLPVIYMDHLDVPRACLVDHTINYSLPRACFVHEMDFYAVVAVDTLDDDFGKRPFSSSTPYGTSQFMSYVDQLAQGTNKVSVTEEPPKISDEAHAAECAKDFLGVPESSKMQSDIQGEAVVGSRDIPHAVSGGTNGSTEHADEATEAKTDGYDNVCGSLEEWLHAIPSIDELELPPHMQGIYNKHKEIHAAEVNTTFSSFGRVLQGMYCKRLGLMLSEVNKAQCKLHEQKDESEDVTFSVPGGASAAGFRYATATEPPPPPQQPNLQPGAHGTVGVEDTTTTEPTPQQPKELRSRPRNHMNITDTEPAVDVVLDTEPGVDVALDTEPAVDVAFDIPAPTKMSDHNNGNVHNIDTDQSNVKVSEQCNKVKNIGQESPRSPSYPSVNLVRRPGTLEDGPSFGLFEPGSDDALLFQGDPAVSFDSDLDPLLALRARSPLFDESPGASAGPVFDVTPLATCPPISTGPTEVSANDTREEVVVEVSSGRSHVEKKPTPKRAATSPETGRKLKKMKKLKVDATDDAIYKQYCCTNYQIKDPPEGDPLPPFIRIGGFDVSFKHFSNGLKKRAQLNNEIMSLYIESFNIEHMYSSTKPKKFAFWPHTASKLAVDPSAFHARSCIKDFERACNKNNIAKCDQLFFTNVQKGHWVVVVANLIQKKFNVFDSSTDSEYVGPLENACSNLIANFKTLVRDRNPWKHNLDTFERFSPDGYLQQSTTYDCGFFSILYMENLTTRGMKPFNTDTKSLLNFRTYIAAKLFKHPQNTLNSAEEFQALLKKS